MVRRSDLDDPECERCGYSLLNLDPSAVHECPECGRAIDWSREYRGAIHPGRRALGGAGLILAPQAGIALVVLSAGGRSSGLIVALCLLAAAPLFTIGGVHMLMTITNASTVKTRASAAIGGLLLSVVLSAGTLIVSIFVATL
jgi:predicted RNA-binding Zn-ribbon protein involved in translation (DUF1610 family)